MSTYQMSDFKVKGIACRPGGRAASKPAVKAVSPKGEEVYWVGASGDFYDLRGTDFKALSENMVSVTSLSTGMMRKNLWRK